MTLETTAPADGQTPAQKEETVQTPALHEETKEETISKAELTRMLKKQAAELTAKYKPFEEKAKKFEEAELAKKTDEEKAAKRLKDLEDKIAEKEKALADRSLKDLIREKIEKAIADGLMTLPKGKTVSSLVARSKASDEADIDSDIEDLIGFFPPAEPAEPSKALGTTTKTGETAKPKGIAEIIKEKNAMLKDPTLSRNQKEIIAKEVLSLQNREMFERLGVK
jgi:hypothetical protein